MTNKQQFKVTVTASRNRKPKSNKVQVDELDNLLMSVLTHPLLPKLPDSDNLRTDLVIAVRDLARM